MEGALTGLAILAILVGLILLSVPVAFALTGASLAAILLFTDSSMLAALPNIAWSSTNVFVLTAAPLFILMSEVIVFTGIGHDLFDAIQKWIGRLPGGLAVTSVVACAILGAISGTGVGVAAVIGAIAIPEMLKRKGIYTTELATGSIAAASPLGMVIPPSLPLIIYGVITETSVADLFLAGVVPGLLITLLFSIWIVASSWLAARRDPELVAQETRATWPERFVALRRSLPIVLLVTATLGSIYAGIATPTEAAAVGAVGAFLIAAIYGQLTWQNAISAIRNATRTSAMLILIVIGAMLFGYAVGLLQVPQALSEWVLSLGLSRWWVFAGIMVAYLFLGMFLEVSSVILITVPILYPTIISFGFDPIWFGIVTVINLCLGAVTPPVGLCLYVVKNVTPGVSLGTIFKGATPFLLIYLLTIFILCLFPALGRFEF